MKQKLAYAAVAAAFGVAAGSAFAITEADTTNWPVAVANQVYMSGATAQNGGIDNVARIFCQDGSMDSFYGPKQVVYVCLARAGTTLTTASTAVTTPYTAGAGIAIHKEYAGGSGNGIAPVRDATTILSFVDLSTVTTTGGTPTCTLDPVSTAKAPSTTVSGVVLAQKNVWNCTNPTVTHVPDIGFSDVDPAVFAQSSTGLKVNSPNQLIFGISATVALRNALEDSQVARGLLPSTCGSTTANVEAAACQPSITNSQLAGLYTGRLTGTGAAVKLGITGDTHGIYLIRRGNTSGTQKTAEVIALNADIVNTANTTSGFPPPGNTNANGGDLATDAYCGGLTAAGPALTFVFAGSANEENVNCLNRHQLNGEYAVAVNTTEFNAFGNPASSSASIDTNFPTGFRYLKINGALPTVANVIKGTYEYFSEQVINWKTTIAGTPSAVGNAINLELGNKTNVVVVNSTFTQYSDANMGGVGLGEPAGQQSSGLLGPGRAASCAATFLAAGTTPDSDPTNFTTKNPTGAKTVNAIKPALAVCPPRF